MHDRAWSGGWVALAGWGRLGFGSGSRRLCWRRCWRWRRLEEAGVLVDVAVAVAAEVAKLGLGVAVRVFVASAG